MCSFPFQIYTCTQECLYNHHHLLQGLGYSIMRLSVVVCVDYFGRGQANPSGIPEFYSLYKKSLVLCLYLHFLLYQDLNSLLHISKTSTRLLEFGTSLLSPKYIFLSHTGEWKLLLL